MKTLLPRRPGELSGPFTNPLWEQVRGQQDIFSDVFAWGEANEGEDLLHFDLTQGGKVHSARAIWVSGDFWGG